MKTYWIVKCEKWSFKQTCHPDYKSGDLPIVTKFEEIISTTKDNHAGLNEITKKVESIAKNHEWQKFQLVSRFFFLGVERVGQGAED